MTFYAVVCGGDRSWPVPALSNDVLDTFEDLVGPDRSATLPSDATHVLLVCRTEWGPAMRRLATLLKAHDEALNVSVLETDTMPLGAAVVAEHVNALAVEPGHAARELRRLLGTVRSVVWVRRPGKVNGARPKWWEVIRSWWSPDGALAEGESPIGIERAQVERWAELFKGATSVHRSGEVPPRPAAVIQPYVGGERVWGRDVSRGARAITGKQPSFEVATFTPTDAVSAEETTECSGCGASVVDFCPFCHAAWGLGATVVHTSTTTPATPIDDKDLQPVNESELR
ncbi:hypothetical protein ACQBAT_00475 [Ornithinimicrobium sp. Y1847]|uniref:hypothetical protein n=1 Tax=Ornithinimicrobium sp. Y1847 TaxID=3405419 RepID=UPI003B672660